MASNFHSELPNDQLHDPKDYALASNSSVLTKSHTGLLDWNASPFTITTEIRCSNDVSGGLHHRAFYLFGDADANKFEIYYVVQGESGTFTPAAGFRQVAVDITANMTSIQVATNTKTAIDRISQYSFTTNIDGQGKLTITGMVDSYDTLDKNTGFEISNTRTYTGTTVLTSTNGVISWLPGGGGGGGGVSSVSVAQPTASTGDPITKTGTSSVIIKAHEYDGGSKVGFVPKNGTSTTFLCGDGTWKTPQTGSTYTAGNGIDSTNLSNNNIIQVNSTVVRTSGTQTIGGNKTFSGAVSVANPTASDSSNRAATTQWVKSQAYGSGTVTQVNAGTGLKVGSISQGSFTTQGTLNVDTSVIATLNSIQSFTGKKTFTNGVSFTNVVPTTVTPPQSASSTEIASCEWVKKELQGLGTGVTDVTAALPLNSSGGTTPQLSIKRASRSDDGYLDKSDYSRFDAKQEQLALTTTGTGAATLVGSVLNIPTPAAGNAGFTKSFKGHINIPGAGAFLIDQTNAAQGFATHSFNIAGKNATPPTTFQMINGSFHYTDKTEQFRSINGVFAGTGTFKISLLISTVDCESGIATEPNVVAETDVVVREKPVCFEIRPVRTVQIPANTILCLLIEKSGEGEEREIGSYTAMYNSL